MIYLIIALTCIACYFIGVMVGRWTMRNAYYSSNGDWIVVDPEQFDKYIADPEDLQHVSYTAEQMGREK